MNISEQFKLKAFAGNKDQCNPNLKFVLRMIENIVGKVKSWDFVEKELTLSQTTNFRLFQTEKGLQMTILDLMKIEESSSDR